MVRPTIRRTAVGVLQLLGLLLLIAGLLGGAWVEREVLSGLPEDLADLRGWRPPGACRILAADGTEIHRFYDERRFWVPLDELPDQLPHSVLVAEDRKFLDHPGVDLRGIARALRENLRAGRTVQGGSTITQQVVKKLLVGQDRTLRRKLREAVLAWRLERTLTKIESLELYLNYVALGFGNYGVEAAAQSYFGRSARDLDPGQSALLAGLVPAPSRYSPRTNPRLAAERREVVLRSRVALGELEDADLDPWLSAPVLQPAPPPEPLAADYGTAVVDHLLELLPHEAWTEQGLDVHTALDLEVQRTAHAAVQAAVDGVRDRQGPRGPRGRVDDLEAFLEDAPGLTRVLGEVIPPCPGACFDAVVHPQEGLDHLAAGPFVFALSRQEQRQTVAATAAGRSRRSLARSVRGGDVLRLCLDEDGAPRLDRSAWAQGSAVVLENATARVVAIVGGQDPEPGGFVRATQARRQPGSTFKGFVYGAALRDGLSQTDRVWPTPPVEEGEEPPAPGPTLRSALARSVNEASVHLYRRRARASVVALASALGVETPLRDDPSVALGSSEVTPLDLASAYAALARMGVPMAPVWVDRLVDVDGGTLGRSGDTIELGGGATLPGAAGPRALPDGAARELVDMLEAVVEVGTAKAAHRPGFARAGKTGTTDDHVDAWFVGMTPTHTIAVWIGVDDRLPLGWGEYGGKAALPAWIDIVESLPEVEGADFGPAPGAVLLPVRGRWQWVQRGRVPSWVLKVPEVDAAPLLPFGSGKALRK